MSFDTREAKPGIWATYFLCLAVMFVFFTIAVPISVIASGAKQSLATGLLRRFAPRNDNLKSNLKILIAPENWFLIWTRLILYLCA